MGNKMRSKIVLFVGLAAQVCQVSGGPTPEDCQDVEFHPDPDNCPKGYYRCVPDGSGGWTIEQLECPGETVFHEDLQICDWPGDWVDDMCNGATHAPTHEPTQEPTVPTEVPDGGKRIVCYYSSWAFYRNGSGKFDIPDIDPNICTHLNYGFANIDNQTWNIVAYDPWFDLAAWDIGCDGDHCHYDSYRRFNQLRQKNPKLKTLLSIGGWNSGSEVWSHMAADPAKRKIFIDSSVAFAKTFDFDGLDFDWEYPGDREGSDPEHDKEDFTVLIQEFGAALHAEGKLFTAAISPDYKRAGVGYDVPALAKEFDFVNVMDYDYHGAWDNFTGHNTPLYGRHEEDIEGHPGHGFNLNDTINYYISEGMPREKINVGLATFGHGFVLPEGSEETGLFCPAVSGNPKGPYTGTVGFWGYYEILQAFNNDTLPWLPGATPHGWTTVVDGCVLAPYSYNGPYWIGYDDVDSIRLKAQWINSMNLGGAMVWSIESDDFAGDYGNKYPIISEVKRIMNNGETLDPEYILHEDDMCETAPSCEVPIPSYYW